MQPSPFGEQADAHLRYELSRPPLVTAKLQVELSLLTTEKDQLSHLKARARAEIRAPLASAKSFTAQSSYWTSKATRLPVRMFYEEAISPGAASVKTRWEINHETGVLLRQKLKISKGAPTTVTESTHWSLSPEKSFLILSPLLLPTALTQRLKRTPDFTRMHALVPAGNGLQALAFESHAQRSQGSIRLIEVRTRKVGFDVSPVEIMSSSWTEPAKGVVSYHLETNVIESLSFRLPMFGDLVLERSGAR